jgi:hypothetical protein
MSGKYLGALFIGNAAIRKAGNIEGWKPYLYEKIQGGILIRGCMTAPKKRGPDKGGTKYLIDNKISRFSSRQMTPKSKKTAWRWLSVISLRSDLEGSTFHV